MDGWIDGWMNGVLGHFYFRPLFFRWKKRGRGHVKMARYKVHEIKWVEVCDGKAVGYITRLRGFNKGITFKVHYNLSLVSSVRKSKVLWKGPGKVVRIYS